MDIQSRNLTVPRGSMLFAKFLPGTQTPGPFREFGNCPEGTLNRESETMPHYSSRQGKRVLDEEIAIQSTLAGTLTFDDMKMENQAYFWMNDVTKLTTTALTDQVANYPTVKSGDLYQLGMSDANPSGHRNVTAVVVTDGAVSNPKTFAVDVDYILDATLGTIYITAGSEADGENIKVEFDVAASTREQIITGETQIEGALKFIADNPVGPNTDIIIPRARLSPNGDFALVADPESTDFQTMSLSISVLKKGNLPLAIQDGRPIA
ncbi:hypothetical protein [Rhizobium wenxiniae]|uniref:phage tail tube protein n=1 Tax=Rhizobium wenxiniae TaxID=1737357 RepID=UPI003C1D0B4E